MVHESFLMRESNTSFNCIFAISPPECPAINLPIPSDILTCRTTDYCTGLHCCSAIDIKVSQLFVESWIVLDPCNFELSIGLGNWSFVIGKDLYYWGAERTETITDSLQIR